MFLIHRYIFIFHFIWRFEKTNSFGDLIGITEPNQVWFYRKEESRSPVASVSTDKICGEKGAEIGILALV